ncbi:hypothetical protein V1260_07685 [Brachybacterium sp. J144]|uniref:hypothetical protein n=1 Tax=Brachybacterium sp. J144 TaxID=3116487 RepID=UPI002E7A6DE3|nr:hypothetical protein [Brachybacterium sp. J144]MEE1650673.1 hypothetical protein [Brachybacterium sp. J144]
MTTNTTSPPLTTRPRPALPRPLLLAGLLTSLLAAVLGLTWALAPQVGLLGGPPERSPLELLLGVPGAAAALGLVALGGAVTALAASVRPVPRPLLLAVAGAHVLVAGVGMGSMSTLSTAGYLLGFAMPLIVAMLVVQVIRRYPRARVVVGGAAAVALLAVVLLLREAIVELAGHMAPALVADLPGIAVTLLLVAVGAAWAGLAVTALRGDGAAERLIGWTTRHRLLTTLVAAACPLPYAVMRLTRLTPWPLLAPAELDLGTRVWGLGLSSGSWLAVVLTLRRLDEHLGVVQLHVRGAQHGRRHVGEPRIGEQPGEGGIVELGVVEVLERGGAAHRLLGCGRPGGVVPAVEGRDQAVAALAVRGGLLGGQETLDQHESLLVVGVRESVQIGAGGGEGGHRRPSVEGSTR